MLVDELKGEARVAGSCLIAEYKYNKLSSVLQSEPSRFLKGSTAPARRNHLLPTESVEDCRIIPGTDVVLFLALKKGFRFRISPLHQNSAA
jgi:hypothetical protein